MKRTLLLLLIGGAVVAGTTCAPQADPKSFQGPLKIRPQDSKGNTLSGIIATGNLQTRVEDALDHVRKRDLLASHSFWTIFHAILGMGFDTQLLEEDTGTRVKAIDQITKGAAINGMVFDQVGELLDVRTLSGSGTGQGHQDQFVAEMCQWGLPPETKWRVNGKDYTFADFLKYSKERATIHEDQELSWAIVIIAQHFGTKATWKNKGKEISLEDCVDYEIKAPIDTAACGGTHRLFGITWALHYHLINGGKKDAGVWKRADEHLQKYVQAAKKYQNGDGSFSSNYVSGSGLAQDLGSRISSSGHVLEWLALVLPDEELQSAWVQNAANAVALMILETRNDPVEGGALYHAAHGLHIYRDRVFGPPPQQGNRGPLIPLPPK